MPESFQFRVHPSFVDLHHGRAAPPRYQDPPVKYGSLVKVLRGKHAGKSGRVMNVERNVVRVLEDVTDSEVSQHCVMYE